MQRKTASFQWQKNVYLKELIDNKNANLPERYLSYLNFSTQLKKMIKLMLPTITKLHLFSTWLVKKDANIDQLFCIYKLNIQKKKKKWR